MEIKQSRPKGRPPVPESEKKGRNFTFRSRGDMHERLAQSSAANQRSISEEIERRLEQSFEFEQQMAAFRETMEKQEKRLEDWRKMAEQLREESARSRAEMRALGEERKQEAAKMRSEFAEIEREMERELEKYSASAAMVDVLIGEDKLKSAFLRRIALELASFPEDWSSPAKREEMLSRLRLVAAKEEEQ